jgi:hypothetical protein
VLGGRGSWALVAIVLVGLVVRLAAIAATPDIRLASDPSDYARHAVSIAHGDGYPRSTIVPGDSPTAIRPPGFPVFLAGVYRLTGDSVTAGRIAQAILGAIAVGLIALIVRELWGWRLAWLAGLLAAVFPPLVIDGMTLLSEPLFVVLELGAIYAMLRARSDGRARWLVSCGVLAGLALLTRANGALLLIPLLVAARGAGAWRSLATYRRPALVAVCAAVVVAPWTIRNAVELHAFIPVADQDGYTAVATYNATSRAHDAVWMVPNTDPATARLIRENRGLDEAALNAKLRAAARRFAADHPGYLLTVALRNTLRLFNLGGGAHEREVSEGDYGLGDGAARLMTFGLLPFLVFAIPGFATGLARRAPRWFWAVPVLMLTPIMILAQNRARAPIDPFLIVLSTLGVAAAARAASGYRARSRARAAGRPQRA